MTIEAYEVPHPVYSEPIIITESVIVSTYVAIVFSMITYIPRL
jgi:hypothetical protein